MNRRIAKKKYKKFMDQFAKEKLYLALPDDNSRKKFVRTWVYLRLNFKQKEG